MADNHAALIDSPLSQAERAYRLLEEMIITMQLAPGAMISESELTEISGFGRTPVREALLRLETEHLVEIVARRGIRIAPIDMKQQFRLHEVRRELELLVANLSARRASQDDRKKLAALAKGFRTKGASDYLTFVRLDRDFNAVVGASSDNTYLTDVLYTLHGLSRRFWHAHPGRDAELKTAAHMHANIADAIVARDAKAIRKSVTEHMDYVRKLILTAIET